MTVGTPPSAPLGPPLPRALANLQYPSYVKPYFQRSPLRVDPPRQVLALGLTERLGPPACPLPFYLPGLQPFPTAMRLPGCYLPACRLAVVRDVRPS